MPQLVSQDCGLPRSDYGPGNGRPTPRWNFVLCLRPNRDRAKI